MQKVNLNLIPGGVRPVINVSQYDEGRQFQLAIFNGSASYDLTGKTVVIEVGKLDGNGVAYDDTDEVNNIPVVAISGNIVTITTPKQMTAVAGQNNAELKISDSSAVIGTLNFILDCEQSALSPDTPISDTQIPALEDLASQNAQKALDAVSHYPYIDNTTKNWMVWDVDTGAFVDTGVRAQGIDGQGGVASVNSVLPDIDGNVALLLASSFSDILPTARGGTGNGDGYIRTGLKAGSTIGVGSTVEGADNEAQFSPQYTHIEGKDNVSYHNYQHINGLGNVINSYCSTAIGKYGNDSSIFHMGTGSLFVVGNGTSKAAPSNAFIVGANGNAALQGYLFKGDISNGTLPTDGYPSAGNNLTGNIEPVRTMHNAHAANSYLYVVEDDQLYQVGSTALAINDTLTPGTNATAVKVTDILGQLNSDIATLITVKSYTVTFTENAVVAAEFSNIYKATGEVVLTSDVALYGTPIAINVTGYGGIALPAAVRYVTAQSKWIAYALATRANADSTSFTVTFAKKATVV